MNNSPQSAAPIWTWMNMFKIPCNSMHQRGNDNLGQSHVSHRHESNEKESARHFILADMFYFAVIDVKFTISAVFILTFEYE